MDSPGASYDVGPDPYFDREPCAGGVTGTCRNLLAAVVMAVGVTALIILLERGGQSLSLLHSIPLDGNDTGGPI